MTKLLRVLSSTLLLSLFVVLPVRAEWPDSLRYRAEAGTSLGSRDFNPLWFQANRYGFSAVKGNSGWLRLSLFKDLDKEERFSWGAGVDLGVAQHFQSTFMPQQLYGEIKYRCLNAMLGAKEMNDGFLDQELSSGALTSGWNARPIPQLRVGIFDYANFWGCKEMFAVKGYIAYGAFSDNWWLKRWVNPEVSKYTLNQLYCSRAIAFRFGNENKFPLVGELGLQMDTEFGGKTWFPDRYQTDANGNKILDANGNPVKGAWSQHPETLKAWLKALIPMGGSPDTDPGEQVNVEGNMFGNWTFALRWQDPKGWMVKLYYQHFFEDHSMLFFDYPWKDGLYGIQGKLPKNPFVSDIVYELIYSKDQASSVYWDHTPEIDYQISGRDGYYTHYIYNGVQHWGQGLGNPLFISPVYNSNHGLTFYSNRIVAHHLGFRGEPCSQVSYRVLLSHTRAWGTYARPLKKVYGTFNGMLQVNYHPKQLPGFDFSVAGALDKGTRYNIPTTDWYSGTGTNIAAMFTVSYSGAFKFKK